MLGRHRQAGHDGIRPHLKVPHVEHGRGREAAPGDVGARRVRSQELLGRSVAGYPADLVRVRDHLIPGEAVDLHRRLGREDEDDLSTTGLADDRCHQPRGRAEVDEIGHDGCPMAGEERRGGLRPEGRRRPGAARWKGGQRRLARRWRRGGGWFQRRARCPRGGRIPGIVGEPQHGGTDVPDQADDQDAAGRDRDEKPSAGAVDRIRRAPPGSGSGRRRGRTINVRCQALGGRRPCVIELVLGVREDRRSLVPVVSVHASVSWKLGEAASVTHARGILSRSVKRCRVCTAVGLRSPDLQSASWRMRAAEMASRRRLPPSTS